MGRHRVAARPDPRGRRSAAVARRGARRRDRAREQDDAAVPGRRSRGGRGRRAALGRRALAVGWAALGIAGVLWLPNLAWQATNGWPQLTMAAAISGYADENRTQVVPLLWLFTGPLLFPVSL